MPIAKKDKKKKKKQLASSEDEDSDSESSSGTEKRKRKDKKKKKDKKKSKSADKKEEYVRVQELISAYIDNTLLFLVRNQRQEIKKMIIIQRRKANCIH